MNLFVSLKIICIKTSNLILFTYFQPKDLSEFSKMDLFSSTNFTKHSILDSRSYVSAFIKPAMHAKTTFFGSSLSGILAGIYLLKVKNINSRTRFEIMFKVNQGSQFPGLHRAYQFS